MGKNPFRKARELSDEQRAAMALRLSMARDSRAKIVSYENGPAWEEGE